MYWLWVLLLLLQAQIIILWDRIFLGDHILLGISFDFWSFQNFMEAPHSGISGVYSICPVQFIKGEFFRNISNCNVITRNMREKKIGIWKVSFYLPILCLHFSLFPVYISLWNVNGGRTELPVLFMFSIEHFTTMICIL